MAGKRKPVHSPRATVRAPKSRASMSAALLQAASVHGLSQEGLARDIGTDARTLRRWIACKVRMNVELVADAPIVGKTFKRLWCTESHEIAPYIASARKRRGTP